MQKLKKPKNLNITKKKKNNSYLAPMAESLRSVPDELRTIAPVRSRSTKPPRTFAHQNA